MNVIGSRPDGWWSDGRGAMLHLVTLLNRLHGDTGDEVTVVLDGRYHDEVAAAAEPGVEVRFAGSRARDAADDHIAALLEEDAEPEAITVVTSDRDLAERASRSGAAVLGGGSFRERLERDHR
jgi:predicted RNA-binding protein with PIN domain